MANLFAERVEGVEESRRIEKLRQDLDHLVMQESKLPPEQQRLESQLEQQRTIVLQREQACEQLLNSKNLKIAELRKGSDLYSSRLGLKFERVGGAADPLTLHISADRACMIARMPPSRARPRHACATVKCGLPLKSSRQSLLQMIDCASYFTTLTNTPLRASSPFTFTSTAAINTTVFFTT